MLKMLKEIHCIRTNVLFYDIMKPKQDENKLFLSYSYSILTDYSFIARFIFSSLYLQLGYQVFRAATLYKIVYCQPFS